MAIIKKVTRWHNLIKQSAQIEVVCKIMRKLIHDKETNTTSYQVEYIIPKDVYEECPVFQNSKGLTNVYGQDIPDFNAGQIVRLRLIGEMSEYGPKYKILYIEPADRITDSKSKLGFLKTLTSDAISEEIMLKEPLFIDKIIDGEDVDYKEIKGVGPKIYAKIVQKIRENLMLFNLHKRFEVFPYSVVSKIMTRMIEDESNKLSVQQVLDRLRTQPYRFLCRIRGFSFSLVDKLLVDIMEEFPHNTILPENLLTSEDRIIFAGVYFITKECMATGDTYAFKDSVRSAMYRSLIGINKETIDKALTSSEFAFVGDDYITTRALYNSEDIIYNVLNKAMNTEVKPVDVDEICYSKVSGFNLTDNQKLFIKNSLGNRVSILSGYAGTGKTQSIKGLIQALTTDRRKFKLLAPTGKAAKVMSEMTGYPASTIHVGLKIFPNKDEEVGENPLLALASLEEEFIIIDEASMIDTMLMSTLLKAINFNKSRIILIGDDAQLPSVGPGNVFSNLKNSGKFPAVALTEVFRYSTSGVAKAATDARNCSLFLESKEVSYGDVSNGIYSFTEAANDRDLVLAKYKSLIESGTSVEDILMLTYGRQNRGEYSATSEALNPVLREIANPSGEVVKFITNDVERDSGYRIGDYVMQVRNNYKHIKLTHNELDRIVSFGEYELPDDIKDIDTISVTNGTTGFVVGYTDEGIAVDFGYANVFIPAGFIKDNITHGYAITIHKSQGSSAKEVICWTPKSSGWGLSSNLLYVAISRSSHNFYHYGDAWLINTKVKIKEENLRKTRLEDLLKRL